MLKSKLLLLIGLVALTIFTLSAGTMAYFTSEAISTGNTISAGTLYIGREDGNRGMLDEFISLEDMLPGDKAKEFTVRVKNLGSLTAYINGVSVSITECDEMFLANALHTQCLNEQGNTLYRGSLLALDGNVVPLNSEVVLEPGESTVLKFSAVLDERAGNWYKGKGIAFSVSLYAGQKPGQAVGRRVIMAEKANVQSALDGAQPGDVVLVPGGLYGVLKVKPGVMVKAGDVVFDTVVEGFTLVHSDGSSAAESTICGFTMNSDDCGVSVGTGAECRVIDSIFFTDGKPVQAARGSSVYITRNDLTGCGVDLDIGGPVQGRYNLSLDLDPDDYAL